MANPKKMMVGTRYAGFWIRFLAAILDVVIIGIPIGLLQLGLAFATGIVSLTYLLELAAIVLVVYMDGVKGGTPGKLILKLRIVNEQNQIIGVPTAILRYICKILSGIILGIGYFMIAFTEKKQGLHDKIAKTYVIYTK